MRSSGKGSKEWKVLIKYKQQTCVCSGSNHVELKLAYRPLSLISSGSFWWMLLPFRSPKPLAPSSSDSLWVCLFPCCWFQRHFQVWRRIAGKCSVINPLPSLPDGAFRSCTSCCATRRNAEWGFITPGGSSGQVLCICRDSQIWKAQSGWRFGGPDCLLHCYRVKQQAALLLKHFYFAP